MSISEDGTLAMWDAKDGRCVIFRSQFLTNVTSPEQGIAFEHGRFIAICGQGPEIEIVNIWNLKVRSVTQHSGDWTIGLTKFISAEGIASTSYRVATGSPLTNKVLSTDDGNRTDAINRRKGILNRDAQVCFISLSQEMRLSVWELTEDG